jgi:shikimate dehydrogenase
MKKYGLIGYPLSHSFSKKYFTEKFLRESIAEVSYELYPIAEISELPSLLAEYPAIVGLNVTIPYKEKVIPYLSDLSPVVEAIGACNCIKISEGKLVGYNTDVIGFEKSLKKKLKPHHTKALILGTGGSSKAVQYVLNKLAISFIKISRSKTAETITYEEIDETLLSSHTLIVNTSPLGMFPNVEDCPAIPYQFLNASHYLFDLVYNPTKTKFLASGEKMGAVIENGSDMLVDQAEASWEIWNEI